jgi:hypothetical protein
MNDVDISHNLVTDFAVPSYGPTSNGDLILLVDGGSNWNIEHNTLVSPASVEGEFSKCIKPTGDVTAGARLRFRNNIIPMCGNPNSSWSVWWTGTQTPVGYREGKVTLDLFASNGGSYDFSRTVMVDSRSGAHAQYYPGVGVTFETSYGNMGFANLSTLDLRITSGPYAAGGAKCATDGTAVGCNIDDVSLATSGVNV